MTQPVQVNPEELVAFSKRFDAALTPRLSRARDLLHAVSGLEKDMFTTVTRPMATVYTIATEYVAADITSKAEELGQFVDRLRATAAQWSAAEHTTTGMFTPQ
jgi:hypothetical protein